MRKRQDPMLFIHKSGTDWRVKIQGYDHGSLVSLIFYKWEYGTSDNAKNAAIEFRDQILQEMEDNRTYSMSWTPNITYFINGLGLEVPYKRICARTPNEKGLPQAYRFNYETFGLRGAFDMAIEALENHKMMAAYPKWVIDKAWDKIQFKYQSKT